MRILTILIACFAVVGETIAQEPTLTIQAYSPTQPGRDLSKANVMAPTESLRVLVTPKSQVDRTPDTLAASIRSFNALAQKTKATFDALQKEAQNPQITEFSTDLIDSIAQCLNEIERLPRATGGDATENSRLATEFRVRFNQKSDRINREIKRLRADNENRTAEQKIAIPSVFILKYRAVVESLDEVVALAADDILRKGVNVKVQLDLYRNKDLSRIPDTEFFAPVNTESLKALMALRAILRGEGNNPISPSDLAKSIIQKFKADYKKMVDDIKADLQDRINKINQEIEDLKDHIQNPSVKQSYEEQKAKLQNLVDQFQNLLDTAKSLYKGVEDPATGNAQSDADLLEGWVNQLNSLKTNSESLIVQTDQFLTGFKAWFDQIPTEIDNDGKTIVAKIQTLMGDVKTELQGFINQSIGTVQQVIQSQIEFLNLVNRLDKIESATKEGVDGRVEFENTNLMLNGMVTPLRSYDEIVVIVQYKTPTDADYKTVGNATGYRIGILKNSRWDQLYALTFSPMIGNSARWQDSITFGRVFKSVSFNQSFAGNNARPGLGIAISVLDQNGDSVRELGIGGLASFFDDRLIGGYGYNFSEKHWYPYVGWRFRL